LLLIMIGGGGYIFGKIFDSDLKISSRLIATTDDAIASSLTKLGLLPYITGWGILIAALLGINYLYPSNNIAIAASVLGLVAVTLARDNRLVFAKNFLFFYLIFGSGFLALTVAFLGDSILASLAGMSLIRIVTYSLPLFKIS
jgi:hypothetical protein